MKQSTIVCRIPTEAFDAFVLESCRQVRPLPKVIAGAARAFLKLSPRQREEFTIGEPMPAPDRQKLGLKIDTAASLLAAKGKRGGK